MDISGNINTTEQYKYIWKLFIVCRFSFLYFVCDKRRLKLWAPGGSRAAVCLFSYISVTETYLQLVPVQLVRIWNFAHVNKWIGFIAPYIHTGVKKNEEIYSVDYLYTNRRYKKTKTIVWNEFCCFELFRIGDVSCTRTLCSCSWIPYVMTTLSLSLYSNAKFKTNAKYSFEAALILKIVQRWIYLFIPDFVLHFMIT